MGSIDLVHHSVHQDNQRTIRVGFSPYTYARAAVMRSFLLKKEDYDRIMKMGPNEIIRFLQDSHYKKEFEEYHVSAAGTKAIDQALLSNLMNNFKKLYHISDAAMRKVLANYFWKYDIENIKIILRGKFAHLPSSEIELLLFDSVNFSKDFLHSLLQKMTVEEVVKSLSFLKKQNLHSEQLFEIENALDHYSLQTIINFAAHLTGQGKTMRHFLQLEAEITNIRTLLRFRSSGLAEGKSGISEKTLIEKYLINPSPLVKKLAAKKTVEEMVKELRKHKYTLLTGEEKDLAAKLEIDLSVAVLRKSSLLVHQQLLSANYILGYLFAKEIEVKNLLTLIKGKKLDIAPEYLEQLLVIGK